MALSHGFDMPAERLFHTHTPPPQEQSTSGRRQLWRVTPTHCFSVALNSKFRSTAGILAMEIRDLQVNANDLQHWLDL